MPEICKPLRYKDSKAKYPNCSRLTEDLYILDILSATLRVSGGLGLLFFKFCSFFESYFWQFLLSEWIRTYD